MCFTEELGDYRTPPQPILSSPSAHKTGSLSCRSLNKEFSPSSKSPSAKSLELSASPLSTSRELSTPGAVVDHVKDQVKDGYVVDTMIL